MICAGRCLLLTLINKKINYVDNGKRPVNAERALRLGKYFGQSPRYWLNLQTRYDMDIAEDTLGDQVAKQVHPIVSAVS